MAKRSREKQLLQLIEDALSRKDFRARNMGWVREVMSTAYGRCVAPCTCEIAPDQEKTPSDGLFDCVAGVILVGYYECTVHGAKK